ncbi:hypothetical protein BC939DRAFT_478397 [Gamsiella multidivaricata]|uniref:uncharacterized protein n=1 Tax=Gamsiella multidivaricata TaxID=101098 RepID=UPI00222019E4|nr:uncharacterized protein BC939DRAFT_478397 [Gamsiella multidivaricata]KAI7821420.1 hypothetical protein BC939DRAFT_478397 [Gamsiella multidivaricata]
MDITDRIQYLKECRHKEPEQLWRGFSDKFRLTVPSSWFDAIARSLDSLQEDSEYTTWAREMKEMLLSKRCQDWRAQYLQPRRSRLQGILQRSTAQESAGAIFNAQSMIRQARHVLSSSVQAELGGLSTIDAPLITSETIESGQTAKTVLIRVKGLTGSLSCGNRRAIAITSYGE